MKIYRNLFLLLIISKISLLNAQQLYLSSQTSKNLMIANPSAMGMYGTTDFTIQGRWQWVGFGNEPQHAMLNFSTVYVPKSRSFYNPSLRNKSGQYRNMTYQTGMMKHSFGGQLIADEYGAFAKRGGCILYALHMPVTRTSTIAFGVRTGFSNYTFDPSEAMVANTMDPSSVYAGGDTDYDKFISVQSSKLIGEMSMGMTYYSTHGYIGLSADQLTSDWISFGNGSANYDLKRHYTILGGYRLDLSNKLSVTPTMLARYMRPAPISLDCNLIVDYADILWFGMGYRWKEAGIAMFGVTVDDQFKFGYSYDFCTSGMRAQVKGGHEIMIGLMLGRK